jgi:hypothetical protein
MGKGYPKAAAPSGAGRLAPASRPYAKLPGGLWAAFIGAALLGLTTPNPLLTAASILLVPVFMTLVWRQGETPVLLFAISFQWLQVTAKVFHANVLGVGVAELSDYALYGLPTIERAVWLGLVGLAVLAVGMRLGMWKLGAVSEERVQQEAGQFSTDRVFVFYLVCTALSKVVEAFAWSSGAFVQILIGVEDIKWIGFFLLGYLVLKRKERYPFFVGAVLFEVIAGIGFFSGFKTAIFVTLIVTFTVHYRLKPKVVLAGAAMVTLLVLLGAGWTSIKGEFRAFLNQGSGMQVTVVSRAEQMAKLSDLIGDLEWEEVALSMGDMFDRIAYVDYFALTLEYVPEYAPHEDGELWKRAIVHILTPRVLNPDKPPLIPDSEITMQYTGLRLASAGEGTSISIGYMGESYVDFGPIWMFVPVFLLGVLWGLMYSFFVSKARFTVVGFAFATSSLLSLYQFEMTGIKMLGGVTMNFIVLALLMFAVERYVIPHLGGEPQVPRRALADAVAH